MRKRTQLRRSNLDIAGRCRHHGPTSSSIFQNELDSCFTVRGSFFFFRVKNKKKESPSRYSSIWCLSDHNRGFRYLRFRTNRTCFCLRAESSRSVTRPDVCVRAETTSPVDQNGFLHAVRFHTYNVHFVGIDANANMTQCMIISQDKFAYCVHT